MNYWWFNIRKIPNGDAIPIPRKKGYPIKQTATFKRGIPQERRKIRCWLIIIIGNFSLHFHRPNWEALFCLGCDYYSGHVRLYYENVTSKSLPLILSLVIGARIRLLGDFIAACTDSLSCGRNLRLFGFEIFLKLCSYESFGAFKMESFDFLSKEIESMRHFRNQNEFFSFALKKIDFIWRKFVIFELVKFIIKCRGVVLVLFNLKIRKGKFQNVNNSERNLAEKGHFFLVPILESIYFASWRIEFFAASMEKNQKNIRLFEQ